MSFRCVLTGLVFLLMKESDLKSIVEDMREELALLKEENKRLRDDNLSGQSLVTRSAHHGILNILLRACRFWDSRVCRAQELLSPCVVDCTRHWRSPTRFAKQQRNGNLLVARSEHGTGREILVRKTISNLTMKSAAISDQLVLGQLLKDYMGQHPPQSKERAGI